MDHTSSTIPEIESMGACDGYPVYYPEKEEGEVQAACATIEQSRIVKRKRTRRLEERQGTTMIRFHQSTTSLSAFEARTSSKDSLIHPNFTFDAAACPQGQEFLRNMVPMFMDIKLDEEVVNIPTSKSCGEEWSSVVV
jgi:hypothetical protein